METETTTINNSSPHTLSKTQKEPNEILESGKPLSEN
jgi:hypothetical protein